MRHFLFNGSNAIYANKVDKVFENYYEFSSNFSGTLRKKIEQKAGWVGWIQTACFTVASRWDATPTGAREASKCHVGEGKRVHV